VTLFRTNPWYGTSKRQMKTRGGLKNENSKKPQKRTLTVKLWDWSQAN
jgi:hypothetical protein